MSSLLPLADKLAIAPSTSTPQVVKFLSIPDVEYEVHKRVGIAMFSRLR
ncbi:hypothetical protein WKK05_20640 [Nostoc sp. UHCC 0302]